MTNIKLFHIILTLTLTEMFKSNQLISGLTILILSNSLNTLLVATSDGRMDGWSPEKQCLPAFGSGIKTLKELKNITEVLFIFSLINLFLL